ncbi:MAG TPA: M23 family metallopeptidase, partial [Polyangiaceae bacterium]|nr:M23 family metallopeptidase [Polyangiaceae bacterium]
DGDSADPLLEGTGAIVFVDVPLPPATGSLLPRIAALGADAFTPSWLRERIVSTDSAGVQHASVLKVPVIRDRPIRIGPPLLRQRLLDLNGCCNGAHTRAVINQPDGLFVSQRFAIDFVQLGDGTATFSGDPRNNESYFLYGADALAVSAGRIVDVRDGIEQNVPGEPLPPAQLDTAAGNYVIEELDDGHFALYAQLQPGSLRVVAGDHVSRGEVLGLVGNSGNSTEPHLHFQVMDRGSPFDADGLPYLFERFQLLGRVDLNSPELPFTKTVGSALRGQRLPLAGDVIGF